MGGKDGKIKFDNLDSVKRREQALNQLTHSGYVAKDKRSEGRAAVEKQMQRSAAGDPPQARYAGKPPGLLSHMMAQAKAKKP